MILDTKQCTDLKHTSFISFMYLSYVAHSYISYFISSILSGAHIPKRWLLIGRNFPKNGREMTLDLLPRLTVLVPEVPSVKRMALGHFPPSYSRRMKNPPLFIMCTRVIAPSMPCPNLPRIKWSPVPSHLSEADECREEGIRRFKTREGFIISDVISLI